MYQTELINAAMHAKRLSNERLAKITGLGSRVISEVRNGTRNPTVVTLQKIASALEIPMSELFTEDAKPRVAA